jgi:hypothetical protein
MAWGVAGWTFLLLLYFAYATGPQWVCAPLGWPELGSVCELVFPETATVASLAVQSAAVWAVGLVVGVGAWIIWRRRMQPSVPAFDVI